MCHKNLYYILVLRIQLFHSFITYFSKKTIGMSAKIMYNIYTTVHDFYYLEGDGGMSNQIIISIGRKYGTRGHQVAEIIAKEMGLKLYDRNILDELAAEKAVNVEELQKFDEKPRNPFTSKKVGKFAYSREDLISELQFDFIRKKADSGESFVIVGRCAETVLRGREGLISIFITGDKEDCIAHVMDKYNLSRTKAIAKIRRHDNRRKEYHNNYSETKWGAADSYDVCVNISKLGLDETARFLQDYINRRKKEK